MLVSPYFFSSMSRPSARQDCKPMVISVNMSAIFFCISWFLASGTPNWILSAKNKIIKQDTATDVKYMDALDAHCNQSCLDILIHHS